MVDPLSVIATVMAIIAIGWQIIQWRIERRAWAVPALSCSMHDYEGKNMQWLIVLLQIKEFQASI